MYSDEYERIIRSSISLIKNGEDCYVFTLGQAYDVVEEARELNINVKVEEIEDEYHLEPKGTDFSKKYNTKWWKDKDRKEKKDAFKIW